MQLFQLVFNSRLRTRIIRTDRRCKIIEYAAIDLFGKGNTLSNADLAVTSPENDMTILNAKAALFHHYVLLKPNYNVK